MDALVSISSADASLNIQDTITLDGKKFIKFQDAVLYKPNENHYNIFVEFWLFNNGTGSFEKYDWFEEYCITYNGRFPLIGAKPSGTIKSGHIKVNIRTQWDGKITYSMPNTSYLAIFGNSPIKLAITIKDRALNTSNTVITPEFILKDIK
jgi:hypothetical protein